MCGRIPWKVINSSCTFEIFQSLPERIRLNITTFKSVCNWKFLKKFESKILVNEYIKKASIGNFFLKFNCISNFTRDENVLHFSFGFHTIAVLIGEEASFSTRYKLRCNQKSSLGPTLIFYNPLYCILHLRCTPCRQDL